MQEINWNSVDWNKRTTDLAKELGVAPSVVSYHRLKNHLRKHKRKQHRIDWSDVDWSKPNFAIAKLKSASPGAVTMARKVHAPSEFRSGNSVKGSYSKSHVRANYTRKAAVTNTTKTVDVNVDLTSNLDVMVSDYKNILLPNMVPTAEIAVCKPAQPSWIKRKLIVFRDMLFNICVSVEREANK